MPVITDSDTRHALVQKQIISPSGRLSWGKLAEEVVAIMHDHVATEGDVDEKEITLYDLTEEIGGKDDRDLRWAVSLVSNPGAFSYVQRKLEGNGNFVLCGRRVPKPMKVGKATITRSVTTRFLTRDPDLMERYGSETGELRVTQGVRAVDAKLELMVRRVPEYKTLAQAKRKAILDQTATALKLKA